jgi:hypothetical protein
MAIGVGWRDESYCRIDARARKNSSSVSQLVTVVTEPLVADDTQIMGIDPRQSAPASEKIDQPAQQSERAPDDDVSAEAGEHSSQEDAGADPSVP